MKIARRYRLIQQGILFVLAVFPIVAEAADGSEATSLAKAAAFFSDIRDKWSSVRSLTYSIESKDSPSDEFKKYANVATHDRDLLVTNASFEFKGPNYRWKTDTYLPATGAHERASIGSLSQGALSELLETEQPMLLVTHSPKWQGFVSVTGYNPVMEAFSFLNSDDWGSLNCPSVQLDSILSPDTWANCIKRMTSITEEDFQAQPCWKLTFGPESGNHDVIYFSKADDSFPIARQHYEGKYLRRDVSVKESMKLNLPGGKSISLPKTLTQRDYFDPDNPKVFCTSEQTLGQVSVNQDISDDDFVIDPAQADLIYDRDTNKMITVPR